MGVWPTCMSTTQAHSRAPALRCDGSSTHWPRQPSGSSVTAPAGVQAARHSLGRVGAFLPGPPQDPTPADLQRQACRQLESLGFRSAWTNELIGKDCFAQLGVLPAATGRMVFGTCVATVWAIPTTTAHAAATLLSEA